MHDELERIYEGSGRDVNEVLSRHFLTGLRKPRKSLVRIFDIPVEIRTQHVPNTCLKR
jgi:hypothetical protein